MTDFPLTLDQVNQVVEHLMHDGTRDGLILANEVNVALGASARRRANTPNARAEAYTAAVQALGDGVKELLGKRVHVTAYELDFIGQVVRVNRSKTQPGGYSVSVDAEDPLKAKIGGVTCHPADVRVIADKED